MGVAGGSKLGSAVMFSCVVGAGAGTGDECRCWCRWWVRSVRNDRRPVRGPRERAQRKLEVDAMFRKSEIVCMAVALLVK